MQERLRRTPELDSRVSSPWEDSDEGVFVRTLELEEQSRSGYPSPQTLGRVASLSVDQEDILDSSSCSSSRDSCEHQHKSPQHRRAPNNKLPGNSPPGPTRVERCSVVLLGLQQQLRFSLRECLCVERAHLLQGATMRCEGSQRSF